MKRTFMAVALAALVIEIAACSSGGGNNSGAPGTSCQIQNDPNNIPGAVGYIDAVATIDNNTGSAVGTSLSIQVYDPDGQSWGNAVNMAPPTDSDGNVMSTIPAGQSVTTYTHLVTTPGQPARFNTYTCKVSG